MSISEDDNHDDNHSMTCGNGLAATMAGCLSFSRKSHNTTTMESSFTIRHNLVEPKQEETDALLAQTMNLLSMEERNHVLHDLHGVADLQEETPNFLSQVLNEFLEELNLIPNNEKQAFRLAQSMSTSFVHDPKLQLGFVRAELYKAKPAAQRMVKYFERKLQLFGQDKLTCPIQLSDLRPEDLEHFRTGFFQLCPERDQTGRPIFCQNASMADKVPMDVRYRLMWYLYSVAAEDEESQRKGAIYVGDALGLKRFFYSYTGRYPQIVQLSQCLPIRLSALHVCYDDPEIHPLIKVAVFVLDRNQQCRLRFHYGSRMECHYALRTFGMPKQSFPMDDKHDTRLNNVETFMKQRRALEAPLLVHHIIPNQEGEQEFANVVPTETDILMGRGKAKLQLDNPGNVRYIKLLRDQYDAYECAQVKKRVIDHVLKEIKSYHGRFLRKDDEIGWIEIDDSHARKKIGHAFRNLRGPARSGATTSHKLPSLSSSDQRHHFKTGSTNTQNDDSSSSMSRASRKRGVEEEVGARRHDHGMSSMSPCAKKIRL